MRRLLYDRFVGETAKQFEAFIVYRDMGPNRTIKKVADVLGKNHSLINKWCHENKWVSRSAAWDSEVDRRKRIGELKAVEDMRKRQIQLAVSVQGIIGQELLKLAEKAKKDKVNMVLDPDTMVRMLKESTALERLNRGEPGEIVQSTIAHEIDYTKLTKEQLKELKRMKKALRESNE